MHWSPYIFLDYSRGAACEKRRNVQKCCSRYFPELFLPGVSPCENTAGTSPENSQRESGHVDDCKQIRCFLVQNYHLVLPPPCHRTSRQCSCWWERVWLWQPPTFVIFGHILEFMYENSFSYMICPQADRESNRQTDHHAMIGPAERKVWIPTVSEYQSSAHLRNRLGSMQFDSLLLLYSPGGVDWFLLHLQPHLAIYPLNSDQYKTVFKSNRNVILSSFWLYLFFHTLTVPLCHIYCLWVYYGLLICIMTTSSVHTMFPVCAPGHTLHKAILLLSCGWFFLLSV